MSGSFSGIAGVAVATVAVLGFVAGGTVPTSAATGLAAGVGPDATGAAATGAAVVTYELSFLPERPDWIGVTATVHTAEWTISELAVRRLPFEAVDPTYDGFELVGGTYTWNGTLPSPTISYRVPVRATGTTDEPTLDDGRWKLVGKGSVVVIWDATYMDIPHPWPTTWLAPDPSVLGEELLYLGPYDSATHQATGEQIQLVEVPGALEVDRSEVVEMLVDASSSLEVGARDDPVIVFVVSDLLPDGYAAGNDMWANGDSRIDTTRNVWVHEYVHTRQEFKRTEEVEWIIEGSAEYYTGLLMVEQGRIDFDEFYEYVSTDENADGVLSSEAYPSTEIHYSKGRRVIAALDAEIRERSGGERSFEDVFRAMNAHDGRVSDDDFRAMVADAAGTSLDGWIDSYVHSSPVPAVPDDPSAYGLGDGVGVVPGTDGSCDVSTDELRAAISDWAGGTTTTDELREIIALWVSCG